VEFQSRGSVVKGWIERLIQHRVVSVFTEMETENSEVDENIPTAEEATEATEGNAGSTEDTVDISQPGVYTEHVFTDPLGVQIPEDLSPVFQSRYASEISNLRESAQIKGIRIMSHSQNTH
jgi:hypothetical protein